MLAPRSGLSGLCADGTRSRSDEVVVVHGHMRQAPSEEDEAVGVALVPMLFDHARFVVVILWARFGHHRGADRETQRLGKAGPEALCQLLPPLLHAPADKDDPV